MDSSTRITTVLTRMCMDHYLLLPSGTDRDVSVRQASYQFVMLIAVTQITKRSMGKSMKNMNKNKNK